MNVANCDIPSCNYSKTCNEKVRKVTFVDKYYSICLNIKDILRAELEACWFDSFPMTFLRHAVTYIV